MAGVVPKRSSGRKQWTLHDGPRGSLKRLQSQMATEGRTESQVVLAKQLLNEQCELDSETKENERLGVYWLIKASEQGNTEATDLLKTCLDTGKGITELNYLDVKTCLSMTQDEKLARKAAREMFASLSNGGEYITTEQLQKKILAIDKELDKCINMYGEFDSDEDTDWSSKSECSYNEKLTEEHLVSAAINYSHGLIPTVNNSLVLSDPDLKALDNIPVVQKSILHPFLSFKIAYWKFIKFLARQLREFFPLAKTESQLFFLLLVYSLVSTSDVLVFIPLVIYYTTLIVMLVTTCQMLETSREFHDFRMWSGLFICYSNGSLSGEESEALYLRNHLKPYYTFFGAFFINLVTYPLIVNQWIPQSELTIISFALTFITLIGFLHKRRGKTVFDFLVFLSFGVNILAKYPYETDPVVAQGWRFLDLEIPTFTSHVIGNGIEFCINFRLVLYSLIPVIFAKIASRENWKATYKILIPHCVTLSWLQVCIISSQGATTFGLLRASLALSGVVLFLPLFGLASVVLPAVALTKWLITSNLVFNLAVFGAFAFILFTISRSFAQTRFRKIVAVIQIISSIFAGVTIIKNQTYTNYNDKLSPDYLSWDIYQRFCYQPVWQEENIAIAQMKCAELQNAFIHWDGYINEIKIRSISNPWKDLADRSPEFIRRNLYCYLGEESENDCENFPSSVRKECEQFHNVLKSVNSCSLQKYNYYVFEISARLSSGIWGKSPEVSIVVEDSFKNFTLGLKPNDHIYFKGELFNNQIVGSDGILGSLKINVNLEEMGCLACSDVKLTSVKRDNSSIFAWQHLKSCLVVGVKFVLNVLLSPVIVFK